jgi:hypothetical protein
MLILRESNSRDWCHSGLSENPASLRQDIFWTLLLDARSIDSDSTPCGRRPPA